MVFVPNGESRMDTAVLLCGTMSEFGLSHRSVKAVRGGFYISPELAGILDTEKTSKPSRATKTSGNRAAKKNSKEE
jgi:hypothetical protein